MFRHAAHIGSEMLSLSHISPLTQFLPCITLCWKFSSQQIQRTCCVPLHLIACKGTAPLIKTFTANIID